MTLMVNDIIVRNEYTGKHSDSNFVHLLTFIALPILQKLSIYRRWFLFVISNDVNFLFTPEN